MVMPNIARLSRGVSSPRYLFQQGGYRRNAGEAGRADDHLSPAAADRYTGGKLVGGERGGVVGAITPWALSSAQICRCSSVL